MLLKYFCAITKLLTKKLLTKALGELFQIVTNTKSYISSSESESPSINFDNIPKNSRQVGK